MHLTKRCFFWWLLFVTVQCQQRKVHIPNYQFDSQTSNSLINIIFSTNCNDFQNFWRARNGITSNGTDAAAQLQVIDNCVQVVNPLNSAINSSYSVIFEVYEHFVYYNYTNMSDYYVTVGHHGQSFYESNLTINMVKNEKYLTHHLLLYNTSTQLNQLSNFKNFLHKTNASQMGAYAIAKEYKQMLILNEIVFYVDASPRYDYQNWITTNSLIDEQCDVGIQLTAFPLHWGNENQTALVTYSSDMQAISIHDTVEYF